MTQRVVGLVGAPGSGKSTYAAKLYASEPGKWVVLELDKWREGMWLTRQGYFDVHMGEDLDRGNKARQLLGEVQKAAFLNALNLGFSVILSECHAVPSSFSFELTEAALHGIEIEWKVFLPSLDLLRIRNNTRPEDHRVPWDVVESFHGLINSSHSWWRAEKNVEVVG
jgi:predicted kinase